LHRPIEITIRMGRIEPIRGGARREPSTLPFPVKHQSLFIVGFPA
jgi:hypothetical protein